MFLPKLTNSQKGLAPVVLIVVAALIGVVAVAAFQFFQKSSPSTPKQPKKIAILTSSDIHLTTVEGIKTGLKELGFVEGKDIVLDIKNPKGDRELIKKMAVEIVASSPDLIVPTSTTATKTILATLVQPTIPIVFVDVGNFQELGISDIKRPGGNMTGVVKENTKVGAKRMELLKEMVPAAKVFGMFINPKHVSFEELKAVHEEAAKKLGLGLKMYSITNEEELKKALNQVIKDRPDGFMTIPDALISGNDKLIAPPLRQAKIPTMDLNIGNAEKSGFLMIYGVYRFDVGKQGARIIAKVLQGESPGEIPVEFALEHRLEINGAVARELNLPIPESIRLRASKIY